MMLHWFHPMRGGDELFRVVVDAHAFKHGLSEEDIRYAWDNAVDMKPRDGKYRVAIGFDRHGREVELVACLRSDMTMQIFHAMTPATRNVKRELGLDGR